MAKIYHAEIFGTRQKKYNRLEKNDIYSVKWKELKPQSEFYLFVKSDSSLLAKYNELPKVTEIFPVNSVGIVTARDSLTLHWEKEGVLRTINNFARLEKEIARKTYNLGKDARDWKVELAQKDLVESGLSASNLTQVYYKPFFLKHTYFTGNSKGFHCMPRGEVAKHVVDGQNLSLIFTRNTSNRKYDHVFCGNYPPLGRFFTDSACITYFAPLNIYPDTTKEDLFSGSASGEKEPNIAPEIFVKLKGYFKKEVTPEQIFYYIYAVLYSKTYRTKYAEFLKIDFPRIPFTKDYKLFIKLGELGKELADLHLLKSKKLDRPIAKFPVDGSNVVEKPYMESERVLINKEQYFEPVPGEVWNYHIGGYQVCHKWLKDRKGRKLTLEERETYCKIVTAIYHTIELQKQIDEMYEGVEG